MTRFQTSQRHNAGARSTPSAPNAWTKPKASTRSIARSYAYTSHVRDPYGVYDLPPEAQCRSARTGPCAIYRDGGWVCRTRTSAQDIMRRQVRARATAVSRLETTRAVLSDERGPIGSIEGREQSECPVSGTLPTKRRGRKQRRDAAQPPSPGHPRQGSADAARRTKAEPSQSQ